MFVQVRSGRIKRVQDDELAVPVLEITANNIRSVSLSLCTIHLRSECHISPAKVLGGRVVRCRTCDREVANREFESRPWLLCTNAF